jgi:hypothetical protein
MNNAAHRRTDTDGKCGKLERPRLQPWAHTDRPRPRGHESQCAGAHPSDHRCTVYALGESHQITARVYRIASDNAAHNTHAESKREDTRRIKPKSGEPRPIEFWVRHWACMQGISSKGREQRASHSTMHVPPPVGDVSAVTMVAPVSNARDETATPRFAIYALVAEGARGTFGLRCGGASARIKRTGKSGENVNEMMKSVKGREMEPRSSERKERKHHRITITEITITENGKREIQDIKGRATGLTASSSPVPFPSNACSPKVS